MDSVTEQECVQQERGKVIYETEERAAGAKWKFRKELRGVGGAQRRGRKRCADRDMTS